jgi:hypothetical protein
MVKIKVKPVRNKPKKPKQRKVAGMGVQHERLKRLMDTLSTWAEEEGTPTQFRGMAPGVPSEDAFDLLRLQVQHDLAQGHWCIVAFRPGTARRAKK